MLTVEEMEALQRAVHLVFDSDDIMERGLVDDDDIEVMSSARDKLQKMIKEAK